MVHWAPYLWRKSEEVVTHTHTSAAAAAAHRHHITTLPATASISYCISVLLSVSFGTATCKLQPSPRCQPRPASRPPLRPTAAKQNGTSCYFVYDHEIRWKSAVPLAQRAAVGGRGFHAPQPGPQHHHRHGHVQAMMRSKCGSGGAESGLGAWGPGSGTAPARCALLRASRRCVSV